MKPNKENKHNPVEKQSYNIIRCKKNQSDHVSGKEKEESSLSLDGTNFTP
jgi:hypothetical protein